MRTLLIGKLWPEPSSSAAGKRTMDLLEALKGMGWPLTFATTAQLNEFSIDLREHGIECQQIAVNDSSFDEWIRKVDPEVVVFDRYMIEEQFGWRVEKACPEALRVLDTSDLHCLREARGQQLKTDSAHLDLYNEVALREVASIFRSDLTFMISEYEVALLRDAFQVPAEQLEYLPMMLEDPLGEDPSFESREHFVMIGNYLHEPNWDAVRWCCESIWPIVRQALPDAELHIYGAYEPEKARQLGSTQKGIFIRGRAKSVIDTLTHYRVNLAPLRFGAGQKGKLADGFLAGTPGVATPIAAESMNGDIDWGCSIESDPAALAQVAIDVYSNSTVWELVRLQGFEIARKRLAKRYWQPQFTERLQTLSQDGLSLRGAHFVGRMLRHHQHRSTEFMSRWIEAKNR